MIWCVFDRDDNTDEMLRRAGQLAEKEGYFLAYSNPAFELWYLLHFQEQTAPLADCNAAIRQLKQKDCLPQYEKNRDVYEQLLPLQEVAIIRAKKRIQKLRVGKDEILCRRSNPVTTVVELVEYLKSRQ